MLTIHDLITAAKWDDGKTAQKCLLSGVRPDASEDWARLTPLHFAVQYGHFHVIRLLLHWGTDMTVKDAIFHESPHALYQSLNQPS